MLSVFTTGNWQQFHFPFIPHATATWSCKLKTFAGFISDFSLLLVVISLLQDMSGGHCYCSCYLFYYLFVFALFVVVVFVAIVVALSYFFFSLAASRVFVCSLHTSSCQPPVAMSFFSPVPLPLAPCLWPCPWLTSVLVRAEQLLAMEQLA